MTSKAIWPKNFHYRLMGRGLGSSGVSSYAIALEAWRRGLEVTFTAKDLHLYTISDGPRSVEMNFSRPDSITSRSAYSRLNDKSITIDTLKKAGLPAPQGTILAPTVSPEVLRSTASALGYPVVLKLHDGSMGKGVLTNITSWEELRESFNHLLAEYNPTKIMLEKHHPGADYRVLVVGGKSVAAVKRIPANILGDGKSTVQELINLKNSSRKYNPFLTSGTIKIDFEVEKNLKDQQLKLDSIPKQGSLIRLRRVANASAGGDVKDVTNTIQTDILNASEEAVRQFPGVFIAGVDVLVDEESGKFVIIEINSRPQIGVNMYPTIGRGADVPEIIVDKLFPGTRRPELEAFSTLRFDAESVRRQFRSGVFSRVTLAAAPLHGYPIRKKIVFKKSQLTEINLQTFEKAFRKIGISNGLSGKITRDSDSTITLNIAAETESAIRPLHKWLTEKLGFEEVENCSWVGNVTHGLQMNF